LIIFEKGGLKESFLFYQDSCQGLLVLQVGERICQGKQVEEGKVY
jgi:hypothetical protein